MTLRLSNVEIPVADHSPDAALNKHVASLLGISKGAIKQLMIRKKSLDARRKARIVYHYQVDVEVEDEAQVLRHAPSLVSLAPEEATANPLAGLEVKGPLRHPPVIIGSGPAGTFAAMVMAEAGQPAVIVERGEAVEQRFRTIGRLRRDGRFSAESNYCFGEGGAGTFSDGKLTCGRNHPLVRYLFQRWVDYGAPREILYDAHPHIGTDYLMRLAVNMRRDLSARGTRYLFGRRFLGFTPIHDGSARYRVNLDGGESLLTDHLVIAIGHSARDTYTSLLEQGLAMAQKPFAMGLRIEHPQEVINKIQFGNCQLLPPAEYKLAAHAGQRGIWTFCMCPGGYLLPTSAQEGHLAINGMSYHGRKSGFANAAVVVNVLREDFDRGHPLDGMRFQEALEQRAFVSGGGNYGSPAQRLGDFLQGRLSKGELNTSYRPGVNSARLDKVLPPFIVDAIRQAVVDYDKKMRGFVSSEALAVGLESKTSAPVVMTRGRDLQSVSHPGIFPAGEGAGFAGGIVSAALDGARIGRAVLDDAALQRLV